MPRLEEKNRYFDGLFTGPVGLCAAFVVIASHQALTAVVQHHGEIAKRKKIAQTASNIVEKF